MREAAYKKHLTDFGLNLIASFEGFRSKPYNDAVGFATVGFGHLIRRGSVAATDKSVTRQEALVMLRIDAKSAADCVRSKVKVPLSDHEFDALVSLVFNIGCGAFSGSTLLSRLNSGVYSNAATHFLDWNRAGGKILPGLVNRRVQERMYFLTTDGVQQPKLPVVKQSPYVIVQRCPVPRKLAPILNKILNESGAKLQSCYRGADAEALLHKYGKRSQRELYQGFLHHRTGFLPANPPGFSTHELRNDGVAFSRSHPGSLAEESFKRGARLPWWAVGIDIDDAHVQRFIKVAAKHGWKVQQTYPHSRAEYHHLNFRRPPLLKRLTTTLAALSLRAEEVK